MTGKSGVLINMNDSNPIMTETARPVGRLGALLRELPWTICLCARQAARR